MSQVSHSLAFSIWTVQESQDEQKITHKPNTRWGWGSKSERICKGSLVVLWLILLSWVRSLCFLQNVCVHKLSSQFFFFFVSSSSHTSLFKCYLFNEQIDCELWNDDTQDAVNGYESLQSTNDDSTSQLRVEGWVEKTFFSVQQEVNLITWVTQVPHFLRCSRTTCSNLRCPSLSVLKSLHGL